MIGDRLYTLTERDVQARWLTPFFFTADLAQAAAAFDQDLTVVPPGFALILRNANLRASPAAGQNVAAMTFSITRAPFTTVVRIKESFTVLAANVNGTLDWQGLLILTLQDVVRMTGSFNAGVGSNLLRSGLAGVLIPLGNIEHT